MDASRYLNLSVVCISYILNNLLSNSCTQLLDVVIRMLVRFMKVKKYIEVHHEVGKT